MRNARPGSAGSSASARAGVAALSVAALVVAALALSAAGLVDRPAAAAPRFPAHLRVAHRAFRAADGTRFAWRGLTAFRLLEMVAHGREAEAVGVLDWSSARGVSVVRVLAMADVLFRLAPEDGRRALPRLLALASDRGLHVEIVALADTNRFDVDLGGQVGAVGAACARSANCLLEVANEPWTRQTQQARLGDPAFLAALRRLVPSGVPVSIGSGPSDEDTEWATGDYVTVHLARDEGDQGWAHVMRMGLAERLSRLTDKPVVDDEPIGAGPEAQPGRRDPDQTHWLAKGVLARLLGLGTTFHYEGGLQARLPAGREATCFEAWRRGLDALPARFEDQSMALREIGAEGAAVVSLDRSRVRSAYLAQGPAEAWVVAIGTAGAPAFGWRTGWHAASVSDLGGVWVARALRD